MREPTPPGPDHAPEHVADERTQLDRVLDEQRAEVAAILDGLTEAEARTRLVPSLTTPIGLVAHATFVEQVWFHVAFAGRSRRELCLPDDAEASFVVPPGRGLEDVRADFLRVCTEARAIAADRGLDDVARHNRRSPVSLRWVQLHLVREHARHCGHGDVLREQLLRDRV